MAANVSDLDLVRHAKQGKLDAFEELTTRYERQIYLLARRILGNEHDAEDVTQVTFISVVEHLAAFREEASFSTWIHRIATFAALKVLRKRRRLDTVPLEATLDSPETSDPLPHPEFISDWSKSPEELAARKEARSAIERALAELDDKHRPVFVLRDVEGFSVRETAEALEISEANVKVRLLRARLQLREQLTRLFGDPQRALSGHSHQDPHRKTGLGEPSSPLAPSESEPNL
jgi:RNA polymerase sigma-70 factor (ECF subfamily)